MENIIILALAFLPVAILLIYIYRKDKHEKEPLGKLLVVFLLGCVAIVPAIILELCFREYTVLLASMHPLSKAYTTAM